MVDTAPNSPWRCELCGGGLRRDDPGTAKKVTAWVKNGSVTARNPSPPIAWAHWACIQAGRSAAEMTEPSLF